MKKLIAYVFGLVIVLSAFVFASASPAPATAFNSSLHVNKGVVLQKKHRRWHRRWRRHHRRHHK